jgi:UDP-N-acetylglucosamine pyrophosphorylase
MNQTTSNCALILAAGKGTRMKSDLPKVATLLNNKPLLVHVVDSLQKAGITNIIVVVGFKKEVVMDLLKEYKNISYVEQTEQLGTGHAVLCAESSLASFSGNLLVCCGDVPLIQPNSFQNLLEHHSQNNLNTTVLSAKLENPKGYGRLIFNENGNLQRIVEEKDATISEKECKFINTGTYIFRSPEVFQNLKKISTQNAQNEYYLPDLIKIEFESTGKTGTLTLNNHLESLGVNSPEDLEFLHNLLKEGKV